VFALVRGQFVTIVACNLVVVDIYGHEVYRRHSIVADAIVAWASRPCVCITKVGGESVNSDNDAKGFNRINSVM